MKTSDIISLFLIKHNITTVFGIIGSANSHIYDSLKKYNIKIINVHNEQTAVIAAGAFYKSTGQIAIALVTAGAGATNSVTGIVSLWADSTPTIIISGQESSNYISEHHDKRMYGTQGLDFPHMVSKTTKYAKTIVDSNTIQNELEKAYSISLNGRKGPVVLDIPFNVQSQNIPFRDWNDYIPEILNNGISNIEELIKNSNRPIFLAGNGIKLSKSVELFKNVINQIQIPVLLTWSGIDILPYEHPLYFGRPGLYGQRAANFILQKSDLIIVLGSRLSLPQTGYDYKEFARDAKVVMIDIDKTEFKSFAHLCIETDCNEFLKQLNINYTNNQWLDECCSLLKQFPFIEDAHKDDIFPNSYRMIDKMSDYLKSDQIIVTDMGTALLSGHQAIRLGPNQKMFSSYGLGEMGYGLPAALGAAISSPDKEILCLNCDGGMMMNIQELQTIIQHKLRVKIVIFNNDGYLMIKHTQKMLFKGALNSVDSSTGIVLPDYMKVADAFGYNKCQIKTWDDFNEIFPKFMEWDGPSICEIFMPPNQDFIPKVKGVVNSDNNSIFAPPLEEMSPLLDYNIIKKIMGDNISKKSEIISRTLL
jgi:acetolactate synthase-1/2/3 large subunit